MADDKVPEKFDEKDATPGYETDVRHGSIAYGADDEGAIPKGTIGMKQTALMTATILRMTDDDCDNQTRCTRRRPES